MGLHLCRFDGRPFRPPDQRRRPDTKLHTTRHLTAFPDRPVPARAATASQIPPEAGAPRLRLPHSFLSLVPGRFFFPDKLAVTMNHIICSGGEEPLSVGTNFLVFHNDVPPF